MKTRCRVPLPARVSSFAMVAMLCLGCSDNPAATDGGSGPGAEGGTQLEGGPIITESGVRLEGGTEPDSGSPVPDLARRVGWPVTGGGPLDDRIESMVLDSAGNFYVCGTIEQAADVGGIKVKAAGAMDVLVAKIKASGEVEWAVTGGGPNADRGLGVVVDQSGNLYISGSFIESATFGTIKITGAATARRFVAKLSPKGEFVWATPLGYVDYSYSGPGIALDSTGNLWATGAFEGTITVGKSTLTSKGKMDLLLVKLASNGDVLSVSTLGSTGKDEGLHVALDASDNLFLLAAFEGTVAFGSKSVTAQGLQDLAVAKISSTGEYVWVTSWVTSAGGNYRDHGDGLALDASGNVYVTGAFFEQATFGTQKLTGKGNTDFYAAKLSSTGDIAWVANAGGKYRDEGSGIAVDGSGNVYVAGHFERVVEFGSTTLTSLGLEDVFVTKISSAGQIVSAIQAGGLMLDQVGDVALGPGGVLYVAGAYENKATFGKDTLTSTGKADYFVAKLTP